MSYRELEALAEEKCKPSLMKKLFAISPDFDSAAELYVKAANGYKCEKNWPDAARCFERAAELAELSEDHVQSAQMFVEAANCLLKVTPDDAPRVFKKACGIYTQHGRFSQAGRIMKQLAESLEADAKFSEAMAVWKQAAEYFELDDYGKSFYSQCITKYAEMVAETDAGSAIEIFEREANKCLTNNLLQFNAKQLFFNAALLHLYKHDPITASVALERYGQIDSRFAESREHRLLKAICAALEHRSAQDFTAALADYNKITPLDPWKVNILYKIQQASLPAAESAVEHKPTARPEDFTHCSGDIDLT